MTLIDEVWGDTVMVIGQRRGLYALLALGLFVPPVLHAAWLLATTAPNAAPAPLPTSGFGLLTTIAALWAQLAIVAAAGAALNGGDAARTGLRRLLPALGIELVVLLASLVLLVPLLAILAHRGIDLQAIPSRAMVQAAGAHAGPVLLAALAFVVVVTLVGARLILVIPVVAIERRGVRTIARSWQLTRGFTWRIVGVTLLFVVVIGVAVLAAQSLAGVAAALIAGGGGGAPAFAATVAGAAVTAALSVVGIVFTARLWRSLDALRPA